MGPIKAAIGVGIMTFTWIMCASSLGAATTIIATQLGLSESVHHWGVFLLVLLFDAIGSALGGAIFNPTATAAFYAAGVGSDDLLSMALRVPAQAAGAVGGVLVLMKLMPEEYKHMIEGLALKVNAHTGAIAEGVLTFVITFAVLLIILKGPKSSFFQTLMLAISTIVVVVAGGSYTGPSTNPANMSVHELATLMILTHCLTPSEIKELSLSNPITIYNGASSSSGITSYLVPAAAVGAMGYCYMWWKGWSFSDVMFVTKQNMANAVAIVSKQLEHVSESLATTKRHLSKRLENLDWKLEEQKEISESIASHVDDVTSNLSQIGFDVETIHKMVSGLEVKIELLENKQDITNSGLWHLCQIADNFQAGNDANKLKDGGGKLSNQLRVTYEEKSVKGLQFLSEDTNPIGTESLVSKSGKNPPDNLLSGEKLSAPKRRIHRSYPVGFSLAPDLI